MLLKSLQDFNKPSLLKSEIKATKSILLFVSLNRRFEQAFLCSKKIRDTRRAMVLKSILLFFLKISISSV